MTLRGGDWVKTSNIRICLNIRHRVFVTRKRRVPPKCALCVAHMTCIYNWLGIIRPTCMFAGQMTVLSSFLPNVLCAEKPRAHAGVFDMITLITNHDFCAWTRLKLFHDLQCHHNICTIMSKMWTWNWYVAQAHKIVTFSWEFRGKEGRAVQFSPLQFNKARKSSGKPICEAQTPLCEVSTMLPLTQWVKPRHDWSLVTDTCTL